MAYDIAQLKTDIASVLHGTTLNSIENINQLIYRGASEVLEDLDPQETKRIVNLASPIYTNVYDYPLPSDLKGNKIIDIRPQVDRTWWNRFTQTYNEAFDLTKNIGNLQNFTINFNNAFKSLRLTSSLLPPQILINSADNITDNGTWTVGGDANNLVVDNINYAAGVGSLKFDLDGSTGIGYIENSTMAAVNLERDFNQGNEFMYAFLPFLSGATPFNSIELRWGSSPTDYYTRTVVVNQTLNSFENGWNILSYAWDGATVVGSPDYQNITYLRSTFNYDIGAAVNNVRVDSYASDIGSIYQIEYYSKYLFRDAATGAFKETVTRDDDIVNLDTETYMVLTNKCAQLAAQQNSGQDGRADIEFFTAQYYKSLRRYQNMYKSEIIKPQLTYYTVQNNRYRRWYGGRYW